MSKTFPLTDVDSELLTARTDGAADLRSPRRRHQPTASRVELDSGEVDVGPMHIVLATAQPADVQPDEERRFVIVAGEATRSFGVWGRCPARANIPTARQAMGSWHVHDDGRQRDLGRRNLSPGRDAATALDVESGLEITTYCKDIGEGNR